MPYVSTDRLSKWQSWQEDGRGSKMEQLKIAESMTITGMNVAEDCLHGNHPGVSRSRFVVRCHGFDTVYIRPENHVILCRMSYQLQYEEDRFTEPIEGTAAVRVNGIKYINQLRRDFRAVGIDGSVLIVSDHQKRYALTLDSDRLVVDWENLARSRDARLSRLGTRALKMQAVA